MGRTACKELQCLYKGAIYLFLHLYGSEIWTIGKNEERFVNAFETRCGRRMLKIKWTDRITNYEVYQREKEERLLSKI
jgi:hypothetical protein